MTSWMCSRSYLPEAVTVIAVGSPASRLFQAGLRFYHNHALIGRGSCGRTCRRHPGSRPPRCPRLPKSRGSRRSCPARPHLDNYIKLQRKRLLCPRRAYLRDGGLAGGSINRPRTQGGSKGSAVHFALAKGVSNVLRLRVKLRCLSGIVAQKLERSRRKCVTSSTSVRLSCGVGVEKPVCWSFPA